MSESLSAIYLSFNERQKNHKKTGHGVPFYNLAKLFQVAFKTEHIGPKLMCPCVPVHTSTCRTLCCAWEEGSKITPHLTVCAGERYKGSTFAPC